MFMMHVLPFQEEQQGGPINPAHAAIRSNKKEPVFGREENVLWLGTCAIDILVL